MHTYIRHAFVGSRARQWEDVLVHGVGDHWLEVVGNYGSLDKKKALQDFLVSAHMFVKSSQTPPKPKPKAISIDVDTQERTIFARTDLVAWSDVTDNSMTV